MRQINRLKEKQIRNAKPGAGRFVKRLLDGAGLYLQATKSKTGVNRNWIFRYELDGERHDIGIGPLHTVGLADAREKARELRLQIINGTDPLQRRADDKAKRRNKKAEQAKEVTFEACAIMYLDVHSSRWKNPKHRAQWKSTLETYAYPVIGGLSVADVDEAHLLKVLQPIWKRIPETASRLRARIENVLGYATASRFRHGDNPARWRGHLKTLLGGAQKDAAHFPALPFAEGPIFMSELRRQGGTAARALEFAILNSARTGDIVGGGRDEKPPMSWSHVDLSTRVWTIPSTKTDTEHRVPLSSEAIALLKNMKKQHPKGKLVFPGGKSHQPLSNMAMSEVIKRMNEKRVARGEQPFVDPKQNNAPVTVHGFRSSFKDWVSERTNFPNIVSEMQLAHKIPDKVEAAYRRGELFTKRANMMKQWAAFLAKPVPKFGAGDAVDLKSERRRRSSSFRRVS